jgi:hypothetical protein
MAIGDYRCFVRALLAPACSVQQAWQGRGWAISHCRVELIARLFSLVFSLSAGAWLLSTPPPRLGVLRPVKSPCHLYSLPRLETHFVARGLLLAVTAFRSFT